MIIIPCLLVCLDKCYKVHLFLLPWIIEVIQSNKVLPPHLKINTHFTLPCSLEHHATNPNIQVSLVT